MARKILSVGRFWEMLGFKQKTLGYALGEEWAQGPHRGGAKNFDGEVWRGAGDGNTLQDFKDNIVIIGLFSGEIDRGHGGE